MAAVEVMMQALWEDGRQQEAMHVEERQTGERS